MKNVMNNKFFRYFIYIIIYVLLMYLITLFMNIISLDKTVVIIAYLLINLLSARMVSNYFLCLSSSLIASLFFNYFFIEPYYSFRIANIDYCIGLSILIIASLIVASTTLRLKLNNKRLKDILYVSKLISNARDDQEILIVFKMICLEMIAIDVNYSFNNKDNYSYLIYGDDNNKIYLDIDNDDNVMLRSFIDITRLALERYYAIVRQQQLLVEKNYELNKANLLKSIAHDIRTPLTSIIGNSLMIMDECNKDIYALASNIYQEALWFNNLVDNIVHLTRIQDKKLVLNKKCELVEDILYLAINRLKTRYSDMDLVMDVTNDIVMVNVDMQLIVLVLINLIDNAIKYSFNQRIIISIKRDNDRVYFVIKDQSPYLSKDEINKIFDLFYSKDNKQGLGLGLSICKSIVIMHDGNLLVKNRDDCIGNEFIFDVEELVSNE